MRQTDTYSAYKFHIHSLLSRLTPDVRATLRIPAVPGGHTFVSSVPAAIAGVRMVHVDQRDAVSGRPTGEKVYAFSRLIPRRHPDREQEASDGPTGSASSAQLAQDAQAGQQQRQPMPNAQGQTQRNVGQPLIYDWQSNPMVAPSMNQNQGPAVPPYTAAQYSQQQQQQLLQQLPLRSQAGLSNPGMQSSVLRQYQDPAPSPHSAPSPAPPYAQTADADLFAVSFEPAHTLAELPEVRAKARAWLKAKRRYVPHGPGSHGQRLHGPDDAMLVYDDGHRVMWDTLRASTSHLVNRSASRMAPDPALTPQPSAQQRPRQRDQAQQHVQVPHVPSAPQPYEQPGTQAELQGGRMSNGQRSGTANQVSGIGRMQEEIVLPTLSPTGLSEVVPLIDTVGPSTRAVQPATAMRTVKAPRFSTGRSSSISQQTMPVQAGVPALPSQHSQQ